jgi:hypothetical protein
LLPVVELMPNRLGTEGPEGTPSGPSPFFYPRVLLRFGPWASRIRQTSTARSARGVLQITPGWSEPVDEARRNLSHYRGELRKASRGELPATGVWLDENGTALELGERGWVEFFEGHVRSYALALRRYNHFQVSCALAARDRRLAASQTGARRGPRARSGRPTPARRRGSRRTSSSRAGPDDDPGEPEPSGHLAGRQFRGEPVPAAGAG